MSMLTIPGRASQPCMEAGGDKRSSPSTLCDKHSASGCSSALELSHAGGKTHSIRRSCRHTSGPFSCAGVLGMGGIESPCFVPW